VRCSRQVAADRGLRAALPFPSPPASQVRSASHATPATPVSEGKMELLIGFVTTLFISLLIFRK
jgi:hypothetical protein